MCIVRHIKSNVLYRYIGNDVYENLITNAVGKVEPELAKKIFVISLDATALINENPNIEKLIKSLSLTICKETTTTV